MADNNDRAGLSEAELAAEDRTRAARQGGRVDPRPERRPRPRHRRGRPHRPRCRRERQRRRPHRRRRRRERALGGLHRPGAVRPGRPHQPGRLRDATANAVQDSALDQGAAPDATRRPDPARRRRHRGCPAGGTPARRHGAARRPGHDGGHAADGNLLERQRRPQRRRRTSRRRSTARSRPTPTSPHRSTPRSRANVGSVDSDAVAVAQQDAIINQNIDGSATANSDQSPTSAAVPP